MRQRAQRKRFGKQQKSAHRCESKKDKSFKAAAEIVNWGRG